MFKTGDKLRCIAAGSVHELTLGNIYTAIRDEEEGILEQYNYVTVIGNYNKPISCHANRFVLLNDKIEEITVKIKYRNTYSCASCSKQELGKQVTEHISVNSGT